MTAKPPNRQTEEMKNKEPYLPSDKMRDLIADNSSLLMVLSRFGICLGFADKTVEEVCATHRIHTPTFLTVANFVSDRPYDNTSVDLATITAHLRRAHTYFIDFTLPMIRRKLIEAIDCSKTDSLGFLIIKFYDEYAREVRNHMDTENKRVFPYVDRLLEGTMSDSFSISHFASHHTRIDPKLKELKDIIIKYYAEKDIDLLNSVLFDIITCERDLHLHCLAEDRLFVPAVKRKELEVEETLRKLSLKEGRNHTGESSPAHQAEEKPGGSDLEKLEALSEREKEIIRLIAKGLTNKEIAEKLFLSVHTVTTHRRNISSKLQIHSSVGITIFAIVNGLLPLEEIPIPH